MRVSSPQLGRYPAAAGLGDRGGEIPTGYRTVNR